MRNLLVSDNIKLTSVEAEDISFIKKWFNDVEFLRYYDMVAAIPKTEKQLIGLIEGYNSSSERYVFAIRLKDTNMIIGLCGFDEIIWNMGVATVFIGIGEKEYIGKGFGKDALNLILDFGFSELNFYRIQLNVIAYNETAKNLYENVGFKKEGVFRSFILRDGKRYDMHLYGMLREEWKSI